MPQIIIAGVTFERAQKGMWVRFGEPDLMITQYDTFDFEINAHDPSGDVTDQYKSTTKEACVQWAMAKGYLHATDTGSSRPEV